MSFNTIRIVSDGTSYGTKIVTASGEEIPCRSVHFTHNGEEAPYVHLVLEGISVDLTAPTAQPAPDVLRKHQRNPKRLDVV